MDWVAFVNHFNTAHHFPVVDKLLEQSKVIEETADELVVGCENTGAKFYLDRHKALVEQALEEFAQLKRIVTFRVVPRKAPRKPRVPAPGDETTAPISITDFQGSLEDKIKKASLQPRFTFDNFAVSNSNQMAYAASQAVAKTPGNMYNPLFIYGTVGVGKTHLSQAIVNDILARDMRKNVLYCSSEQFTNDLVEAIRSKKTAPIRDKYRKLDVLIVDDVQFIAGKNYVQEEFYHTFNSIVHQGGQIILASDRSPKEIKQLEDRLRSRFSGGLIIDMQSPDFELRTAILLIKAKERNIDIDMDAAQNIAEKITDSRELEGALLKLLSISLAQSDSNKITTDTANTEMEYRETARRQRITPEDVLRAVATFYNLKPSHIKSPSRKQNIAFARQVLMYLLRHKLHVNLDDIAYFTKRKDHTTIMHGVEKIEGLVMRDDELKNDIQRLYDSITAI